MPNDKDTNIQDLKNLVETFVSERDWHQFHSPKNLSMSLAIEVAELMEHFQWITPDESRRIADKPEAFSEVRDELADVICYAIAIANELDIDISQAMRNKMVKNRLKYPAEAFRGRYGADDPNQPSDTPQTESE